MSNQNSQNLSATTSQWMIANSYDPKNLNQRGENGDTALMKATREGVYAGVEELINAGADINATNNDNNNANINEIITSLLRLDIYKFTINTQYNYSSRLYKNNINIALTIVILEYIEDIFNFYQ